MTDFLKPLGVIIAGGESARFGGGDKFLSSLGRKTVLDHVIERARPQVSHLLLNINSDPSRVESFALETLGDGSYLSKAGFVGPLGGILAGLKYAKYRGLEAILTFPADTPFIPRDVGEKLTSALMRQGNKIAIASSDGRPHPVMGLWSTDLLEDMEAYLLSGERRVMVYVKRHSFSEVAWEAVTDSQPDPFFNINRSEDLAKAEAYMSLSHSSE